MVEIYLIIDGDVSSSVQQRFDHIDVFVLCGPDDWRPAPAVLKQAHRKSREWTTERIICHVEGWWFNLWLFYKV